MAALEERLREWAKPPSDAQKERCENAERMICNAIEASSALQNRGVRVFVQGSYGNNTNTARNSDVDVGVVCESLFFPQYPDGESDGDFGNSSLTTLFHSLRMRLDKQ